jgi:hypothetical protein
MTPAAVPAPAGAASMSPVARRRVTVLAVVALAVPFVAIAIWDLEINLPFNDDWGMRGRPVN